MDIEFKMKQVFQRMNICRDNSNQDSNDLNQLFVTHVVRIERTELNVHTVPLDILDIFDILFKGTVCTFNSHTAILSYSQNELLFYWSVIRLVILSWWTRFPSIFPWISISENSDQKWCAQSANRAIFHLPTHRWRRWNVVTSFTTSVTNNWLKTGNLYLNLHNRYSVQVMGKQNVSFDFIFIQIYI